MSQNNTSGAGRAFAVLAYIVPLLGGLVALIVDGRNQLTRVHAQQSIASVITLFLSFIVWAAGGYIIALVPGIGPIISTALFTLVIAMAVFLVINWLFSFIQALRGEARTIPLANRIAIRVFGDSSARRK